MAYFKTKVHFYKYKEFHVMYMILRFMHTQVLVLNKDFPMSSVGSDSQFLC